MDSKFIAHLETLKPQLLRLLEKSPITPDQLPSTIPRKGIYLLSEGNLHLYVDMLGGAMTSKVGLVDIVGRVPPTVKQLLLSASRERPPGNYKHRIRKVKDRELHSWKIQYFLTPLI